MRIYIRNAEKDTDIQVGTSSDAIFDHDIKETEVEKIKNKTVELIEKFGNIPVSIVCSPFKRSIRTGEVMRDYIKEKYDFETKLYVDNNLSKYISRSNVKKNDIPVKAESYKNMQDRIRKHNEQFLLLDCKKDSYWFVTHGKVIGKLCSINRFFFPIIPNLGTIIFKSTRGTKNEAQSYINNRLVRLSLNI